ncbi:MAG: hypothetical protein ABSB63_14660 [Spirochaetia bacterium]|jgi:hypothetical protein
MARNRAAAQKLNTEGVRQGKASGIPCAGIPRGSIPLALARLREKTLPIYQRTIEPTMSRKEAYARAHGVHPVVAASRIQHARKDFRTFANLAGRGEIRRQF